MRITSPPAPVPGIRLRRQNLWLFTLNLLAVAAFSCAGQQLSGPQELLDKLRNACLRRDAGAIMLAVDPGYLDTLGGRGRLEDDLRQLFTVYGKLDLRWQDVRQQKDQLESHLQLYGRRFRYSGPQIITVQQVADNWLITSGLLEIPRGILDTLRERRLGLEENDLGRLRRIVSEDYRGPGGGRKQLLERLATDLEQGPQRALVVNNMVIEAERRRATVIQSYLLILGVGKHRKQIKGREKIRLLYQVSRWRIAGGLG